jgi:alanine racemase
MRPLRPTVASIHLGRLRANLAALAELAAPARVGAVVKADAYGHGAVVVARALRGQVDAFCVATVEEGLTLREAGVHERILILAEPPVEAAAACAAHALEPLVSTEPFLEELSRAAAGCAVRVRVHLDVDTGMHRTGTDPESAAGLAKRARELGLEVVGVASHLVRADEETVHPTTRAQLAQFEAVAAAVGAPERHVLATAGLLAVPEARYERVRLGIGLYGYAPVRSAHRVALAPVLRLASRVVRLERLEAGEAVSYGHRAPAPGPLEVATVPIGYADGLPRAAFEAGLAFRARGLALPIAGTVTMDHTMLAAPLGALEVGDEVELIGDDLDADAWARALGTIPYEVLARLGPRIPRVAVSEHA